MSVSPTLQLSPQEFQQFQKLVYDRAGIAIGDEKVAMLSNRLRKRLRELQLTSFQEYYNILLKCKNDAEELSNFLSAVSTNETYFFRNDKLWQFVGDPLIDWLVKINQNKTAKSTAFWSAASSSGEEAYTLALVLRNKLPNFRQWKIEIVGTDISQKVLNLAQAGCYNDYAVHKINPADREKYFEHTPNTDQYELKSDIRKMVDFQWHNLRDPFKRNHFDVVFLRNVMMYFDLPMKKKVMDNVVAAMKPGAYFITGDVDPMRDGSGLKEYSGLDYVMTNTYRKPAATEGK